MWDPYQPTHTAKLEKVQKFAAKLATGLWSENYDHLLSLLNWPPLATRQQRKLLLCRRILTGNSIIPPTIFTPHPAPDLGHCHNLALYRPPTRTQAHLGSYLPSVVPLWNSLPQHTVSASSQFAFKCTIKTLHSLNVSLYSHKSICRYFAFCGSVLNYTFIISILFF